MKFFWINLLLLPSSLVAAEAPNIVVFMVDDLGWNHLSAAAVTRGTHSPQYQTPNIEQLAKDGLSFSYAYAQPNCAPTRAAMLSGQYPARIHNQVYVVGNLRRFSPRAAGAFTKTTASFIPPDQSNDVAVEAVTVAEALRQNGYATAHIGKYHVGGHTGPETMPENSGFDVNLGGFSQGHQPTCFAKKSGQQWKFPQVGLGHFDRWSQPYSADYLTRHRLPVNLEGTNKHISDALGDALEETLGRLAGGNKPFYLQFHTYAVHGPVRARPDLLSAAKQRVKAKAEYHGFIAGVDANLSRLRNLLSDPDQDGDKTDSIVENTLILFTSDNGGTHASNSPLKGHKGMLTEGGIRVPLIACWPGVIPADSQTERKVHCLDFYPTFLELAGNHWQPDPAVHPLDGESFATVLREPGKASQRGPICYFFPGYMDKRAQPSAQIIDDIDGQRFKLYYEYEADAWQLYCLSDDPGESKDLIGSHPEIASTLSRSLRDWLVQKHPTWKPRYPVDKRTEKSAGPPPLF